MTIEIVPKSCPRHPSIDLELKEFYTKPYKCDGCNMTGVGPRYGCPKCDYIELHRECWSPPDKKTLPFLKGHIFKFMNRPPQPACQKLECNKHGRWCDACGMPVVGFHYRCDKENLDLHPRCAMLESRLKINRVEFKLNSKKMLMNKKCEFCDSKRVKGCEKDVPGWWYASSEGPSFHVFCVMNWAVEKWHSLSGGVIKNVIDQDGLALVKLELKPLVNNKKRKSTNGKKYWKLFRTLVTTIISVIFGDSTTILANLTVNTAETVVHLLRQD